MKKEWSNLANNYYFVSLAAITETWHWASKRANITHADKKEIVRRYTIYEEYITKTINLNLWNSVSKYQFSENSATGTC